MGVCVVYMRRGDMRAAKPTLTDLQIPATKKKIKNKQNPRIAGKPTEVAGVSARNPQQSCANNHAKFERSARVSW
jgi:hypothetical protein